MASITLSWNANPSADNVTAYKIFGANGTGVAFGSCALLATVSALTWIDAGLSPGQARTYYIKAVNAVGVSATPEGPLNVTAASASGTYVQNAGSAPSIQEGTFAAIPAAGTAGRVYIATDTKAIYRDNGSSWDSIGSGGGGGGTSTSSGGIVADGSYDYIFSAGISTFTHSFAASGNLLKPQRTITIYSAAVGITTVTGGVYLIGIAPYDTVNNKITAAPAYTAAFTETSGTASAWVTGSFSSGVTLTGGQNYIIFIVRTDAGTTPSTTLVTSTAEPVNVPGWVQQAAPNQSFHLASVAPGTSDVWTTESGFYQINFTFDIGTPQPGGSAGALPCWTLSSAGSSGSFANAFAAHGCVLTPDNAVVIYGATFQGTTVTGATYKVGAALWDSVNKKIATTPVYSNPWTCAAGNSAEDIAGVFTTPLSVAQGQAFTIFFVRTDATGTTSATTNNVSSNLTTAAGFFAQTAVCTDLASTNPQTTDVWTVTSGTYHVFNMIYSLSSTVPSPGSGVCAPFTAPNDANFSWNNQGSATTTTNANGGVFLLAPTGSGDNLRIREYAAPAAPFTVTACFLPATLNTNYHHVALCFRDSVSGKLVTWGLESDAGWAANTTSLTRDQWTNVTTHSAGATNTFIPSGPIWLRMQDDGTNRIYSFSTDGYNFITVLTEARGIFVLPDHIGWCVDNVSASVQAGGTLLSWNVTTP